VSVEKCHICLLYLSALLAINPVCEHTRIVGSPSESVPAFQPRKRKDKTSRKKDTNHE
jgi:hypothetical protein